MNTARTPLPSPRLAELRRRRPDAEVWLGLLGETLAAVNDPAWGRAVTAMPAPVAAGEAPLLCHAALAVEVDLVRRHVGRLLSRAALATGPGGPRRDVVGDAKAITLLESAIADDVSAADRIAEHTGLGVETAHAVIPLLALPLLHACRAAWAWRVAPRWAGPYCPICGAWPTLAEVRGFERTRRFRCFRCGGDWHAGWLCCPFCANDGPTHLDAHCPSDAPETRWVETCRRCRGYMKTLTTLRPCPAADLGLLDVETVGLDVAAVRHGSMRPAGSGYPLGVTIRAAEAPNSGRRAPVTALRA